MSSEFEKRLRSALRPVEPDDGFAERVAARIARGEAPVQPRAPRWHRLAWPVALATGLMLAAVGVHEWREHQEEQRGLEARRQLLEALRVTGEKLDIAYQAINDERQPAEEENAGA